MSVTPLQQFQGIGSPWPIPFRPLGTGLLRPATA
jgi:hypothetical protein